MRERRLDVKKINARRERTLRYPRVVEIRPGVYFALTFIGEVMVWYDGDEYKWRFWVRYDEEVDGGWGCVGFDCPEDAWDEFFHHYWSCFSTGCVRPASPTEYIWGDWLEKHDSLTDFTV